jgi:hypothetical protein
VIISVRWIAVAFGLLLGIGMIDKKIKQIRSDHSKKEMNGQLKTLTVFSWIAFFRLLSIVFMTNPRLLT